jgi:cobalamin biosynthesis protein CobT
MAAAAKLAESDVLSQDLSRDSSDASKSITSSAAADLLDGISIGGGGDDEDGASEVNAPEEDIEAAVEVEEEAVEPEVESEAEEAAVEVEDGGADSEESEPEEEIEPQEEETEEEEEKEEEEAKRPVGRPELVDPDLDAPAYAPEDAETPHSLGVLVTELLKTCAINRMTQKATTAVFDMFKKFLPVGNTMPNYRHARRLVAKQNPLRTFRYAVCPQDCWIHKVDIGKLYLSDKRTLKEPPLMCIKCGAAMMDGKNRVIKVSEARGSNWRGSNWRGVQLEGALQMRS